MGPILNTGFLYMSENIFFFSSEVVWAVAQVVLTGCVAFLLGDSSNYSGYVSDQFTASGLSWAGAVGTDVLQRSLLTSTILWICVREQKQSAKYKQWHKIYLNWYI